MAFVLEVDHLSGPLVSPNGTTTELLKLGEDKDTSLLLVMRVMLVPSSAYNRPNPLTHDIQFGIQEFTLTNPITAAPIDFGNTLSKRYINSPNRQLVLNYTISSIVAVAQHADPDILTMHTDSQNLEEKALKKYGLICDKLEQEGYELSNKFESNGRWFWELEKK